MLKSTGWEIKSYSECQETMRSQARKYYLKETRAFKVEGEHGATYKLLAHGRHLVNDSYYEELRSSSNVPPFVMCQTTKALLCAPTVVCICCHHSVCYIESVYLYPLLKWGFLGDGDYSPCFSKSGNSKHLIIF